MGFPTCIQKEAFEHQGKRCAYCGKNLKWENKMKGLPRAWHPHHKKSKNFGGTDTLGNCAILCINYPNCHFYIGHNGDWKENPILYDEDLPYLYYERMNRFKKWIKRNF